MKRSDEEYCREAIENFYLSKGEEIYICEGSPNEAPDYFVIQNENKIALEVTQANSIYVENGSYKTRRTIENSIFEYFNILENKFGCRIIHDKFIAVFINGPIMDFRKFKKNFSEFLDRIIDDEIEMNKARKDGLVFKYQNNEIKIRCFDKCEKTVPNIICILGLNFNSTIPCLNTLLKIVLEERIRVKEEKTETIEGAKWQGEKWLAIIDDIGPLSNISLYESSFKEISIPHSFDKIFVVFHDSKVLELL